MKHTDLKKSHNTISFISANKGIFAAGILLLCSCATLTKAEVLEINSASKNKAGANNVIATKIYINRGAERDLCKEIQKLFTLPENKNYLYSQEQINGMSEEEKQREWKKSRELFIPHTDEFKNFVEPLWKDVSGEDTDKDLLGFIDFIEKRPEINGAPIKIGKDYRIQKSQIDMNQDGTPETVFRSVSTDSSSLDIKESVINFISIRNFKKPERTPSPELNLKGQIVLYKNEPLFLNRELGLAALTVQPALENSDILASLDSKRKYQPLGCTISNNNVYVGD